MTHFLTRRASFTSSGCVADGTAGASDFIDDSKLKLQLRNVYSTKTFVMSMA